MNMTHQKYCYISHPLNAQRIDDLRPILNNVLSERGFLPFYVNQTYEGNTILFSVCKNIYLADLCIFEIARSYPQIYIEIGIALAYNKPIIIIAEKEHHNPLVLQGFSTVSYTGYLDLRNKLGAIVENVVNQIYPDDEAFCKFCNQICESMLISQDKNSFVILNKTGLLQMGDWDQIKQIMTSYFSDYHMYPVYSTDIVSPNRLCDIKRKVYSSRFSLSHPGYMSDELSYLGLGLTIGKRYPWILIRKKNDRKWPEILEGVSAVSYETYKELSDNLGTAVGEFAREITPSQKKIDNTSGISILSFWFQLDDWIEEQNAKNRDPQGKIVGSLKLIRSLGIGVIDKYIIPPSGLTLGFNNTCDVVIDHEYASGLHAQILVEKNNAYYLEDLESKNGTYLNGKRIPSRRKIKLTPNSIIRIPGAKFLVADDSSNIELSKLSSNKQRNTGLLNRIDLPNEFPPDGNEEDDFPAILKVRLMPEGKYIAFAIQSYYRMGKVLPEVQKHFQLEGNDYCFSVQNFELVGMNDTFNRLNLLDAQDIYLRKFSNLVTAILTDYEYEIMEPNSFLPCVHWIVSAPEVTLDANPQRYAVFIKKNNISEKDIDDLQTSTKIISGNMGASLLSIIITADSLGSVSESVKDKAVKSKVKILNYATLRKSLMENTQRGL